MEGKAFSEASGAENFERTESSTGVL